MSATPEEREEELRREQERIARERCIERNAIMVERARNGMISMLETAKRDIIKNLAALAECKGIFTPYSIGNQFDDDMIIERGSLKLQYVWISLTAKSILKKMIYYDELMGAVPPSHPFSIIGESTEKYRNK